MPELPHSGFGHQVADLRIKRRLSQEKLAPLCAVHRNYIGRVERAEMNLTFDRIVKLSAGLKIKPSELFALIPRQKLY